MAAKNDKKKILIDSVRKLIELKVPDEEIIMHLGEVGIEEEQAKALVKQAKQPEAEEEQEETKEEEVPVPQAEGISAKKEEFLARFSRKPPAKPIQKIPPLEEEEKVEEKEEEASEEEELPEAELEESMEGLSAEEGEGGEEERESEELFEEAMEKEEQPEEEKETSGREEEVEEKKEKPMQKQQAPQQPPQPRQYIDISKLWEKGILSAVDQRLNEMKKISQDVDKAISKRADDIAKKEIDKVKVLFESQHRLLIEKVNAQIEKKSKEVEQIIDQKIAEMKSLSQSIKKETSELERKRTQYKEFLQDFESRLSELEEMKGKLLSSMNTELIRERSSLQEFLDSAKSKITEMDERVNKTLEVSSSIIEGLQADAETKLQGMAMQRGDELNREAREQLEELKDTQKAFESQIKEHLQKISSLEKNLTSSTAETRASLEKDIASEMKRLQEARQKYEKLTEGKLNELEALSQAVKKEFDPEMFKQQMSDLEVFKKQFVKVIESNVGKFNEAIQKINEQAKQAEEQINRRMNLIDRKIKELDEFEKNFAAEMGLMVEKSIEQKKSKKGKK